MWENPLVFKSKSTNEDILQQFVLQLKILFFYDIQNENLRKYKCSYVIKEQPIFNLKKYAYLALQPQTVHHIVQPLRI